mmetsp:Transcript_60142/g.111529  ORF Transcript_60142/g.111529 Transcript_60142/m.111529 type:complete len:779 (+) Transcript_60142:60-2396(+)
MKRHKSKRANLGGGISFFQSADLLSVHEKAAWILHEGLRHRFHPHYPDEPHALLIAKQAVGKQMLLRLGVTLLLLLTLFEVPVWCNKSGWLNYQAAADRCAKDGRAPAAELEMSGIPFLPVGVSVLMEYFLLAFVIREILSHKELTLAYDGIHKDLLQDDIPLTLAWMAIVDATLFVIFPGSYGAYRFAPYLRFGLAVFSIEMLRGVARSLIRCVKNVAKIMSILMGVVFIFAWIAASIFDDVEGNDVYGDPINAGFEDFGSSLYTAFLTSTASNYPDALVNSVVTSRAYLLLWFPYILLTVCLLSNVLLAAVYGSFTSSATEAATQNISMRNKSVQQCWKLLMAMGHPVRDSHTGEKAVTLHEFQQVCHVLQDFTDLQFDITLAPVLFEALDSDDSGHLAYMEFQNMCEIMERRYTLTYRDSQFVEMLPTLKRWCDNGEDGPDLGYEARYHGSPVHHFFQTVLALNSLFIVVESVYDFNDWKEPHFFELLDCFFSFIYLLEVGVKLLIWSWEEYWVHMTNRFDFITSIVLAISGICLLQSTLTTEALRNINMLRLVRLLKALDNVPVFQETFDVIGSMILVCSDVLLLNVLVIGLWSAIGTQLFGGRLYDSNPLLKGSAYLDSHYEVFNFNDMGTSFLTLFYFVLTGWVDEVALALVALTEPGSFSWYVTYGYLLSFYIFGFMLAFNVWTAFSIDVFCNLQDISKSGRDEADLNLDDMRLQLASQGKCLHVGTSASLLYSKLSRTMFDVPVKEEQPQENKHSMLTSMLLCCTDRRMT